MCANNTAVATDRALDTHCKTRAPLLWVRGLCDNYEAEAATHAIILKINDAKLKVRHITMDFSKMMCLI